MRFRLSTEATIKHLNVRKEGEEDDKQLAVDIKIDCDESALLCDFFDEKLQAFLFNDIGAASNVMLEAVRYSHAIQHIDVDFCGFEFRDCELKKFQIMPKDGNRINMVFSVTIMPRSDELAVIAEHLGEVVQFFALAQPDLLTEQQS